MYQIRYKDPMTGLVLESQSQSLTEAVEAIKKAKDDLYYRGHSLPKEDVPVGESSTEDKDEESSSPPQTDDYDYDDESYDEPSYHDYWHPHGVVLW